MDYSDHYTNSKKNKDDEDLQTTLLMNNLLNGSPRWVNAISETRNK